MDRLILYTPEVLYAVIAHYNATVFPAQLIAGALALIALGFVLSGRPIARRIAGTVTGTVTAVFFLWCGLTWFGNHYETINWAGFHYAIAFAAQALLLLLYAVLVRHPSTTASMPLGLGLAAFTLAIYPLIEWATGKDWAQAQYVGSSPDATVVFTLGLLAAVGRVPVWLMAIPVFWLLLSGVWSLLLGTPDRLVLPALGLGFMVLIIVKRKRQRAQF